MMRFQLAFVLFLCGAAAFGQDFQDPFTYAPGPTVPGYTQQRGIWTETGTAVQGSAAYTFQELSYNGITDADACVEVTALYDTVAPGLQYAGPMVRYSGSGATATYFMAKVQDNGTPYTGFDRFYVYYYNGSGFNSIGIASLAMNPTVAARVRLQVKEVTGGVRVDLFIDADLNGTWDYTATTTTTFGIGTLGNVGATVYRSSLIDELRYFGSTMTLGGTPTIGTSVPLQGYGLPNYTYIGAMSLGHGGIPAPGGHVVPLDPDAVFFLSLDFPLVFQNFIGLAGADGSFTMTLNIPPDPTIVGLTLFASAVMWDGVQVVEVTPDTQVTIQ